jgi:hypothetical protein
MVTAVAEPPSISLLIGPLILLAVFMQVGVRGVPKRGVRYAFWFPRL